ncbi:MAG: PKD domain-containing protein, partial [Flavobacteriales bacterium]|nr:PKD domain-containing protein [Flavobacteriales bacterium]
MTIKKTTLTLLTFLGLFILPVTKAVAHSVQIQYCVSCTGDLRIWVEHWHSTESPTSTTMTIDINIGGSVTTQTSSPGGGIQNTAPGALPGCSTPITYGAGCPGDEGTYNDWAYYDFPGLPSAVPITFTIISGNTVFTQDACGMYPLSISFTVPNTIGSLPDQNLCGGSTGTPSDPIVMGATDTWTNNNTAIGLGASGTGTIPSFVPVGPPGTTATITYSNSCASGSFDLVILEQPSAVFTTEVNGVASSEICLGEMFDFPNTSSIGSGGLSWLWDFGDGNTSTANQPSHLYTTPGVYNVNLTATSDSGCADISVIVPVTVNSQPIAAFTADSVCEGLATNLTDATTTAVGTIATWEWDILNDNSVEYLTQNTTHVFPGFGTYAIELVVGTAAGCMDSIVQNVEVFANPQVSFSVDTVCVGFVSSFTDLSTIDAGANTTWLWDFGDVSTANTQNTTHTYATFGIYNVQLDVTSDNGCTVVETGVAVVNEPPVTSFTVTDQCDYVNVVPLNTSSISSGVISYVWDFGDASALDLSANPSHTYQPGIYQIVLVGISGANCVTSDTNMVTVYDKPVADYSVPNVCVGLNSVFVESSSVPTVISADAITMWEWDVESNGSIDYTIQNPTHLYPAEGGHNTTLIVTTAFGCKDTIVSAVTVWPLPVVDFSPEDVCLNALSQFFDVTTISSAFSANSIATWDWDFGEGSTSIQQSPFLVYSSIGTYNVQLIATSLNGCVDSITKPVAVNPLPVVDISSPNPAGCTEHCVNLVNNSTIAAGSLASFIWYFGTGDTVYTDTSSYCFQNPSLAIEVYNIYFQATSDKGCVSDTTLVNYISIYPAVYADFGFSPEEIFVVPGVVEFTDFSQNPNSWDWDLGDGEYSTDQHPVHTYADSGWYDVTLMIENPYGCRDT